MDGKLKLAVVSHSLVAERQFWFFDWLTPATMGTLEVMKVAPSRWGKYTRSWGFPVINEGNMVQYEFYDEAFKAVQDFKPDIIYVQQEAYCKVTAQFLRFAKSIGSKFVLFVWENLNEYTPYQGNILKDCDLVVCGNGRAEGLVKPHNEHTLRCIQVGVQTSVFVPGMFRPAKDVIFQGRMAPEKGYRVLQRAAKRFSVLWPEPNQSSSYTDLPTRYNDAKVHASPSIDSPWWKEQHAGYANLEALSCGLYVATSDSVAIVEALNGCPGVKFSRQGDHEALRKDIEDELSLYDEKGRNIRGREWVVANFGYDAIAKQLVSALEALF